MVKNTRNFWLLTCLCVLGGCEAAQLLGAMGQSNEYQKLIEVPPRYTGLENSSIAVFVEADLTILYEHPHLASQIAGGVSARLQRDVPGARVLNPQHVINWQYRTPQWNAMPYGEIAEMLNVDRILHVDLLEYRLHPVGNRWLWDGVCVGRIGVIERNGIDPDMYVESFDTAARFPNIAGVTQESASQAAIETGLLAEFIKRTAWLFHQHLEPKYPGKYRPELEKKK